MPSSFIQNLRSYCCIAIFFLGWGLYGAQGNIQGIVNDAITSLPISGATVNLYRPGGILAHTTTTDGTGHYTITGNPQNYILTVEKNGYQTFTGSVKLLSNQTITVNVPLNKPPGAISGTVSGPPAGATILQLFFNNVLISTTYTDSSNQYSFQNLAPGNYTVSASSSNYATQVLGATVLDTTTTLNFSLSSTSVNLTGNVSDGTNPISGAVVQVKINGTVIQQTTTDLFGNYAVNNLFPQTYNVVVSAVDYTQKILGIDLTVSNTLNFILTPNPGILTGFVYDPHSVPIFGASVGVYFQNVLVFSTFTSQDGSYTISGIAPNNYVVNASALDYATAVGGAVIKSNSTTTLNFELTADKGTLTGNIKDNFGNNLPGVLVQAILNNVVVGTTLTDSNGDYTFLTLEPNSYAVNPILLNYGSVPQGAVIKSNSTTTLNFVLTADTGILTGNVQDNLGNNLPGVLLQAILNNVVVGTALTDNNGDYTFLSLAPNSYAINPILLNYGSVPQGAVIKSNSPTTLNFELTADTGILTGNVQDNLGNNLPGVILQAFLNNIVVGTVLTDSNGNYTFLTLAPNSYAINPILLNYGSVPQGAVIQSNQTTTLNFELIMIPGQPQNLQGRVVVNQFLLRADRVHVLSWNSPLSYRIQGYCIYRNGSLVATIPSYQSLVFEDHNRSCQETDLYQINAFNIDGVYGSFASVSLR